MHVMVQAMIAEPKKLQIPLKYEEEMECSNNLVGFEYNYPE